MPVIVKGVNCAEDVEVALTAGADGVYVTNHGGREIDGAPATIDVLPEVVEAVNGRCPVIFDGGVRRGSHVFKALALGADLVGIGRPYLYGLALGGPHGVASIINELNDELKIDMQLTGCKTIEDVKHARLTDFQYAGDTKLSSSLNQTRLLVLHTTKIEHVSSLIAKNEATHFEQLRFLFYNFLIKSVNSSSLSAKTLKASSR